MSDNVAVRTPRNGSEEDGFSHNWDALDYSPNHEVQNLPDHVVEHGLLGETPNDEPDSSDAPAVIQAVPAQVVNAPLVQSSQDPPTQGSDSESEPETRRKRGRKPMTEEEAARKKHEKIERDGIKRRERVKNRKETHAHQEAQIAELQRENASLRAENVLLRGQIARMQHNEAFRVMTQSSLGFGRR